MPKKIKVQITDGVSAWYWNGKKHVPGEIVEIPPKLFVPEYMEKVAPTAKVGPPPPPPVKEEKSKGLETPSEPPKKVKDK